MLLIPMTVQRYEALYLLLKELVESSKIDEDEAVHELTLQLNLCLIENEGLNQELVAAQDQIAAQDEIIRLLHERLR